MTSLSWRHAAARVRRHSHDSARADECQAILRAHRVGLMLPRRSSKAYIASIRRVMRHDVAKSARRADDIGEPRRRALAACLHHGASRHAAISAGFMAGPTLHLPGGTRRIVLIE